MNTITITEQMIDDVNEAKRETSLSSNHHFSQVEKLEYDSMKWRGRTLYDGLRTRFGYDHKTAFILAITYGV